jgi:hypothetical protein
MTRHLRCLGARRTSPAKFAFTIERLEARIVLSPLTWTAGVDLPAPRGGAAAVDWGDAVLVLGGGTTTVNSLAPGAQTWRTATPLDLPRSFLGVASLGNAFLVYGGSTGQMALDEALNYDPSNGDLTQDAPTMSTPRAHLGAAGDGANAYAIGGLSDRNVPLASVERYSFDDGSWSAVAPLPQPLYGLSAVSDGAGHLFTFGGAVAGGTSTNVVYRYTIATHRWDSAAPMPVAEHDGAAVLGPNGKVYVLGGVSSGGALSTVQTYDLASGTWATETSLPYAVSSAAAVTDSQGHVVVIGGFDANGAPLATVTVSQRLNVPDQAPVFTSSLPVGTSVFAGTPFTYQVTADGNPQPTFALVSGPQGMTIDPHSGLVSFTPGPGDLGTQTAVVRATNFAGSADQTFSFNVLLPAPTGLTARAAGPNSIALAWTPPADIPSNGYYRVFEQHFIHSPRGSGGSYVYALVADHVPGTTVTIGGLRPATVHTYVVQAATPSGAQSPRSAPATAETYTAPTLFAELLLIAQNYGQPGGFAQGDLNFDGVIDFADILLLAQSY